MQHMDSVVNDGPKLEPSQIKNIEFWHNVFLSSR
jgi:hypothetical protein